MAISALSSCSWQGRPKDAQTCLASFLVSSPPSTVDNSIHQLGVLHLLAFHVTHSAESVMPGSSGIFLPLSSDVPSDPHKKEATAGFSSSGSPKLAPSNSSSPNSVSGLADWLGAGLSAKLTWHHLLFCLSLDLWQSRLLDLAPDLGRTLILLNLSISPSKAAAVDSAFWCTLHFLARLLSTKLSCSRWGLPLLGGWESSGPGRAQSSGTSSPPCGWSRIVANTSSATVGFPGGDPGNLWSLYTSWYISINSSLLVSGLTSSMVGTPASGLSWGICCWQPQWRTCSTSFHPSKAAWQNISCSSTRW